MSPPETGHAEVVAREARGELTIGVDRVFARRFYTDVPIREIEQETGEAPYFEKLVVFGAFIGSPLVLFAASAVAVFVLHWWAGLVIPLGFLSWLLSRLQSPRGRARLSPMSMVLAVVTTAWLLDLGSLGPFLGVGAAFVLALWLDRLIYTASTFLLRAFVIRNSKAFNWLKPGLVIRETAGASGQGRMGA